METEGYRNGKRHRQINRVTDSEKGRETEIVTGSNIWRLKTQNLVFEHLHMNAIISPKVTHTSHLVFHILHFTRTDLKVLPLGMKTYL